jgi:hypothetical protein
MHAWQKFLQSIVETRHGRHLLDAGVLALARRRVAQLDSQSPWAAQNRVLSRLVRRGRRTKFGKDHDFARISSYADFRRLVPLCRPGELASSHRQVAPIGDETWPGDFVSQGLATRSLASVFPFAASAELVQVYHLAWLTALGLATRSQIPLHLLDGQILTWAEHWSLPDSGEKPSALEAHLIRSLPAVLQSSFTCYDALAREAVPDILGLHGTSVRRPVKALAGPADRLLAFFARLQQETGCDQCQDVFPHLAAIFYSLGTSEDDRRQLIRDFGENCVLLQYHCDLSAPIAIEDPRHQGLRLLTDNDVFFEFIPEEDFAAPEPRRLHIGEVQFDSPYALAITSPAGIWACLGTDRVIFERPDPPIIRLLSVEKPSIGEQAEFIHQQSIRTPRTRRRGELTGHLRQDRHNTG